MNSELLTPAIKLELERLRTDIETWHWDRCHVHGRLKDGVSFACPVETTFGPGDIEPEAYGLYEGTMIIEIRDSKLNDYWVGDWQKA